MIDLDEWLSPYRPYVNQQFYVETLEKLTKARAAPEDAQALFDDLLAPLEIESFSAKIYSAAFSEPDASTPLTTTPEGAVEFCFNRFRKFDRVEPQDAAILARAYAQMGAYEASEISTAYAYLTGDRSVSTLALLSGMAIRRGRLEEGDAAAAEAEARYPDLPEPGYYRALCLLARGETEAGVQTLAHVGRRHPQYQPAWELLLDTCLSERLWDEAVRFGREAVDAHPREALLWERLSVAYRGAGKANKAVGAMRTAMDIAAQDVGLSTEAKNRLALGAAALEEEAGLPVEALSRYQALLRAGVSDPAVFVNAASCLKRMGKTEEAETLLRTGLRSRPDDPGILTNLGEILYESGRDEESFAHLQRGFELAPKHTDNLFLLAALCFKNRRFEDSIAFASALAASGGPRATAAFLLIGDAYRFTGKAAAALAAYREAQRLDPGHEEVAVRIAQLEEKSGSGT